jgi:chromosome partitioning protein
MSIYALWNNKGGVGKIYLSFQIAAEYARTHPEKNVLVVDVCPQCNVSVMLLGGMQRGEGVVDQLGSSNPRRTIAGYVRDRIASPYHNTGTGSSYVLSVRDHNEYVPSNSTARL